MHVSTRITLALKSKKKNKTIPNSKTTHIRIILKKTTAYITVLKINKKKEHTIKSCKDKGQ